MGQYTHLSIWEREFIVLGISKGLSVTDIARQIKRNKSTVSREFRRNQILGFYSPSTAEEKYRERRLRCRPRRKLKDSRVFNLVKEKFLEQQWSPQQISERIRHKKPPVYL